MQQEGLLTKIFHIKVMYASLRGVWDYSDLGVQYV